MTDDELRLALNRARRKVLETSYCNGPMDAIWNVLADTRCILNGEQSRVYSREDVERVLTEYLE